MHTAFHSQYRPDSVAQICTPNRQEGQEDIKFKVILEYIGGLGYRRPSQKENNFGGK